MNLNQVQVWWDEENMKSVLVYSKNTHNDVCFSTNSIRYRRLFSSAQGLTNIMIATSTVSMKESIFTHWLKWTFSRDYITILCARKKKWRKCAQLNADLTSSRQRAYYSCVCRLFELALVFCRSRCYALEISFINIGAVEQVTLTPYE